jgi:tRNA (mo5U34)-methyltransferase
MAEFRGLYSDKIMDILREFKAQLQWAAIEKARAEQAFWYDHEATIPFKKANLFALAALRDFTVENGAITLGKPEDLSPAEHQRLNAALQAYKPWRKGPFNFFGKHIEAEWRSDRKFERLFPHLPTPENLRIADVGANNGYFMMRLAPYNPKMVIGFEPVVRYAFFLEFMRNLTPLPNLQMELLGWEHLDLFPRFFDVVLCLGVLYHTADPIRMLRNLWQSLKPGGTLILESQGIPGDDSHCLFPEKRYGKVPGMWFIPTRSALINMVRRAGFKEVELFFSHQLSTDEQRQTLWMPWESLSDFLDPGDHSKTVEGYPAPWRFYVKARKLMN